MARELRVGDLVSFSFLNRRNRYKLGMVIKVDCISGLIKVKWCDGHVSSHAEFFLKRIA